MPAYLDENVYNTFPTSRKIWNWRKRTYYPFIFPYCLLFHLPVALTQVSPWPRKHPLVFCVLRGEKKILCAQRGGLWQTLLVVHQAHFFSLDTQPCDIVQHPLPQACLLSGFWLAFCCCCFSLLFSLSLFPRCILYRHKALLFLMLFPFSLGPLLCLPGFPLPCSSSLVLPCRPGHATEAFLPSALRTSSLWLCGLASGFPNKAFICLNAGGQSAIGGGECA